jgi:predicted nucleotidyltransferase
MNKFEKTIGELKPLFPEIKEILVVILYGSVSRGDYSLRHSDLDILIILDKKKPSDRIFKKINDLILKVGSKNGVQIHIEFQSKDIREEDYSLIEKMIEEGKILYSRSLFILSTNMIGLKQYIIYDYSSDKPAVRTRISQILRGKKSWYKKEGKKIVKEYKGIADDKKIILIGKGSIMVEKEKQKEITGLFDDMGINYKTKKIVYA